MHSLRAILVALVVVASTRAEAGPAHASDADRTATAAKPPTTTATATAAAKTKAPAAKPARTATTTMAQVQPQPSLDEPIVDDPETLDAIELGTSTAPEGTRRSRALSAAGVGGIYVGLYGWITLAWYVRTNDSHNFQTHDEGWFGADTYAGGSDKLGHAWGNYALVRGVSQILRSGGWSETQSLVASSALAFSFFTMAEIKDGYKIEYGFSYGDMIMNAAGNALGVVMEMSPELDRRLDFRISYLPSDDFKRALKEEGPFNTPEDYTGQTFLLAYHLGSNELLTRHASWAKYFDVNLGYQARNYKPAPSDGAVPSQDLFVGLSLNVQAMTDAMTGRSGRAASALHFVTEMYQPPFTTLRVGGLDRNGPPVPAGVALDGIDAPTLMR